MSCELISGVNISEVWRSVFQTLLSKPKHEISPLVVQVEIEDYEKIEVPEIKEVLDSYLKNENEKSCRTVANTIFPESLWNKLYKREKLYKRYEYAWPKINKYGSNNKGTYFQRMIAYNSIIDAKTTNQLEHIIETWIKGNHLRSALQVSIFDPRTDHNHSRQKGFPCLQQLAFNPHGRNGKEGLEVIAFYANQAIVEKAYGNYLGLIKLGNFMAHEMHLNFIKLTCISSVAKLSSSSRSLTNLHSLAKKLGIQ
jgi:hypothetical protein